MRYRPGLPLTLKGFSAHVAPKAKTAIVGRTGAGKSSLIHALLRLVEISHDGAGNGGRAGSAGGRVLLDGVDVALLV